MILPNTIGIVVIEALKTLKKPVPLAAIVSTVASMLDCPQQHVMDLVTEAVKGGVHYGYIQESRQRFAFFPINLSGLSDEDNLYGSEKKKSTNIHRKPKTASREFPRNRSTVKLTNAESNGRVTMNRSASAGTYNRLKDRESSPIKSALLSKVETSSSKSTSLALSKDSQELEPKLRNKWKNEKIFIAS